MTFNSNEIKQKWQPNIPTYDSDDGFSSGSTETSKYVIPRETVYTLEKLEKETLERWSELNDLGVLATSSQSVELNSLGRKKDFLSRLRHISEPRPVVPSLSLRELVDSLLDAFAALLKTKGYERLANLIILDFRIEEAIGDLVVQIKEILSSIRKLQNFEGIYDVVLGGEGQKPLNYYNTPFIPSSLVTDTVFTRAWYENGAEIKLEPFWSITDYLRDKCPSMYVRYLDALRIDLETNIEEPLGQINVYIARTDFPAPLRKYLQSITADIKNLAKVISNKMIFKSDGIYVSSELSTGPEEQRWTEMLSSRTTRLVLPNVKTLEGLVNSSDINSVKGNIVTLLSSIRESLPGFFLRIGHDINGFEGHLPDSSFTVPIGNLEGWSATHTEAGSVVDYNKRIVISKKSHSGDRPTLLLPPDGNDSSWHQLIEDKTLVPGAANIFSELFLSIDHELSRFSNNLSFDLNRVKQEITLVKDLLVARLPITELIKAYVSPTSFQGPFRNVTGMLSLESAPNLLALVIPDFSETAENYRKNMSHNIQKVKDFIHDFQNFFEGGSYVAPTWRGLTPQNTMKELWLFLKTIKDGTVTTLGNSVSETSIHNLSVGQVYFHTLKLLKRAYAVQSTFANGDPYFHMQDFQESLAAIRSMLLSQYTNSVGEITDRFPCYFNDRFYVPDYTTNYPLMRLIREVLLAGERWASTKGKEEILAVWTEDRRIAVLDNLVRIEKEEEDLNNPNVRNTLFADLREAWKELRNIARSGFDTVSKELESRTNRIHISGERMAVLKAAHDSNKFKIMHIYRDIDNVLSSEIPRFIARHWAPGINVREGDLFLFKGTIHRSKNSGITNFAQVPLPPSSYSPHWERPVWNSSIEYSPNDLVIRQEGSEEFIYRCIKSHKGIKPLIFTSISSPHRENQDHDFVWEALTLQHDTSLYPGDFVFSLDQNSDDIRDHRTDASIYTCFRAVGAEPPDHTIRQILDGPDYFKENSFGTNIRRIKHGNRSESITENAGAVGKWTSGTPWSSRKSNILYNGISDIDLTFSKEQGFWVDYTAGFPIGNFRSNIPLTWNDRFIMPDSHAFWEFKSRPTSPDTTSLKWLKKNASDGTLDYLIGGHLVGEEKSSNIFNVDFSHRLSSPAKFGASVLQLLEMFFFSSSYSYLIGEWGICTMSPASACSFGYVESTRYADLAYAYVRTVPTSLFENLIGFIPFDYYEVKNDFRYNHVSTRWRGRFRDVLESNSRKGMDLLKDILKSCDDNQLFTELYKDCVQTECERFMWKSFLIIEKIVSKFLSLFIERSNEGDFVTPEEVRLMARLFSLMVAIIISIFSGDDRLKSAVAYENGVLKFDDSVLDTVFISENDAEIIIQRSINMALDFINRKENKKPLSDEGFSMNIASDLQILQGHFPSKTSDKSQEERFFHLNEQRI